MQLSLFLPFAAFLAILVLVWGHALTSPGTSIPDWRRAVLRASVISSLLLLAMGELLALLRLLDRPAVAVYWGAVLGAASVWAWRSGAAVAVVHHLRAQRPAIPWRDGLLLGGMAVIVAALGLVAWLSPASNVDSLLYHMSRVVHWAQDHSLAHYPTVYTFQLTKPIFAELAILDLRLLWGTDRPAALVQWSSMLGSLILVSWIAKVLGAPRRGQILAALFALSIPMGILQATSTQNDYVVAFWVTALLAIVARAKLGPMDRSERVELAAVVGLGTVTKGTFPVYALPILAWHFVPMLWRQKPTRWLLDGAMVLGMVVLCNLGFWSRNLVTFGGPYGPADWLRGKLTFLADPSAAAPGGLGESFGDGLPAEPGEDLGRLTATPVPEEGVTNDQPSSVTPLPGKGLVRAVLWPMGRWVRYIVPNLVTPIGAANALLWRALLQVPALVPPENLAVLKGMAWNHEDSAGNPIHLALVLLSMGMVLAHPRRRTPAVLGVGLVALAGYLLIPLVIGGGAARWGLRYQLPFFVGWAPVFGVAIDGWLRPRWSFWVGAGLLVASLPYLLLNNTRPLVGMPPWPTRTGSVLVADPSELAFAILAGSNDPGKGQALLATAELIEDRGCSRVGLRIDSNGLEYLYWWVLEAPQSGISLEILNPTPESARYSDANFAPCMVVCTICDGASEYRGFPLITDFGGISLYGPES